MSKAAGRLGLLTRDLLLGLALFLALSMAIAATQGESLGTFLFAPADARTIEAQPATADGAGQLEAFEPAWRVAGQDPERPTAMAMLALVFSMMVALNLWFYRHLRRSYASPRPWGRRRG